MKKSIHFIISSFIVFGFILSACNTTSTNPSDDHATDSAVVEKEEVVKEEKKEKKLSVEEKTENLFVNTTIVFSGTMVLAFTPFFQEQAASIKDAFMADDANADVMDEQIKAIPEDVQKSLDELITEMKTMFDDISEEEKAVLNKLIKHEAMKEGVAIADKHEMPEEYRPLTQDLEPQELKAYILYISALGKDASDDPVLKMYQEVGQWFATLQAELKKDEELKTLFESMKK